jgi:hypothetical protein
MAPTSLLRPPAPAPAAARRTTYRHGRPVRRRRGPGLLGLVVAAALAGWLAVHAELVDVSSLLGRAPEQGISVVELDGSGTVVASSGAGRTHWTASLAKLFVVQQLLEREEAGTVTLDEEDRVRMRRRR